MELPWEALCPLRERLGHLADARDLKRIQRHKEIRTLR